MTVVASGQAWETSQTTVVVREGATLEVMVPLTARHVAARTVAAPSTPGPSTIPIQPREGGVDLGLGVALGVGLAVLLGGVAVVIYVLTVGPRTAEVPLDVDWRGSALSARGPTVLRF